VRFAVIVLDSAERDDVFSLAAEGVMPRLADVIARGARVALTTPVEYHSEYAATELVTGRCAASNRYWSTVIFDPRAYDCVTVGSAPRPAFWSGLAPRRVVAFDVPHSVVDPTVDGLQVVGWGGHDARFQHPRASQPAALLAEIDDRFGTDPVATVEFTGSWHQPAYLEALATALRASARRRGAIGRWLLEREPDWDLFVMGMPEPHSAGHNFSQGTDPGHPLAGHPTAAVARRHLVDVYRAVDETIGRIAASLPDDAALAIVAAKGMRPVRNDVAAGVLLPELLHRVSFGRAFADEPTKARWARRGRPPMFPDVRRSASDRTAQLFAEGPCASLKRRYHAAAPRAVVDAGRRLRGRSGQVAGKSSSPSEPSGAATADAVLPGSIDWHPAMRYRDRWSSMRWFALPTFSDGQIRVNLCGREADGKVALDDYERCCDELETMLRACRDPRTGEGVIGEVVRLREDDPLDPEGPGADLVVTFPSPVDAMVHPEAGTIGPFTFPRSGSHTTNGFLVVAGPGVPVLVLDDHPALDVAPTLLALLGAQLPARLDGSPIAGLTRVSST
jgi:predicted AlkP superfamily phosphohydrolase/phosphomutase